MRLAKRPCSYPLCSELVESGYCPKHANESTAHQYGQARRDDPQRMQTNSTRWLKLRRIVLARDPVCRICGNAASTDADHIVPIREGGAKWDSTICRARAMRAIARRLAVRKQDDMTHASN